MQQIAGTTRPNKKSHLSPKRKRVDVESISSENLTKELAYLLGVYLTDGCITERTKPSPNANFTINVIDRDFAEKTLDCIKTIIPTCKAKVHLYHYKPSGFNKKESIKFFVGAGFVTWKDFFQQQSGFKHHLPSVIWDAPLPIKKWFIAGIMDGDGWIAEATIGRKNKRYNIGIGGVEEGWIWEFKIFMEKLGVSVNSPELIKPGYRTHKKPFVRMKFNVRSFIGAGLFFAMERKQKRLLSAIEFLKTIQERNYNVRNVQRLNAACPTGQRYSPNFTET